MFRAHARLLHTALVTVVGLALVSIYAWPGYLALDSVEQLEQARAGTLTDWHPPIMSALWGVLDRIVPGALLMFLLQCGLFLVGLHVLLHRRMSPWRAAVLTLVIFLLPPNLTTMAVVLKDSLMCGALLVGCAGITSERRAARVVGLVAFGFAAGLRYNSVFAVVTLLAVLSPWPSGRAWWLRAVTGSAIAIALTAAAWLGNRAVTDVKTHPFHWSVAPMDIVGTLTFAPDLADEEVRELLPGVTFPRDRDLQAQARAAYNPNIWWGTLTRGHERVFDEPQTPEQLDAVAAGWRRLVLAYPGAYLVSRLHMLRELVGFTEVVPTPVYAYAHERSMLAYTNRPAHPRNVVQRWLSRKAIKLGKTSLVYKPFAYVFIALALLVVMLRDRLVLALLGSAFVHVAALVIVMPSPDARYIHWLLVVTQVALALRLFQRRSAPSA